MGRSRTPDVVPRNTGKLGYVGVANVTHLCNQCAVLYFGREFDDLHFTDEGPHGDRLHYCYGCGWTLIDIEGNCLLGHHMETLDYKSQWQDTLRRFFGDEAVIVEDIVDQVEESDHVGEEEGADSD